MKRGVVGLLAVALFGAGCAAWPSTEKTSEAPVPAQEQVVVPNVGTASGTPAENGDAETAEAAPAEPAPKPAVKKTTTKSASVSVTITDEGFGPRVLPVSAGTTVVWTNKSSKNQTVHSDGSNLYDSGNIPPGGTYKRVFEWPGSYVYYTATDTKLKGTVVVR